MKRKDLRARFLAEALTFSLVAGMFTPAVTVWAADENVNTTAIIEEAPENAPVPAYRVELQAGEGNDNGEENSSTSGGSTSGGSTSGGSTSGGSTSGGSTGGGSTSGGSTSGGSTGGGSTSSDNTGGSDTEGGNTGSNDEAVSAGDYVLMNIPYDEFYQAELSGNDVKVDAFSSATLNKTRTKSLVDGSYHKDPEGTDISGITYPVKIGEGVSLSGCKLISAGDVVTITVTNRGQTSTTSYEGKEALFENEDHAYYVLNENEEPDYYKDLTVDEDGNWIFGKSYGEVTPKTDVEAELLTESTYGDYQLNLDGLDLSSNTAVYAVVLETKENQSYGLRHMENIWRQTELSWCTGFTKAIHNCPTSSEHYKAIMGQTITNVVYYTSEGIFNIPINEYVPKKFDYTLSVNNASTQAGSTTFTLTGLPDDFDAQYTVEGLDIEVSGNSLSFRSKTEGVDVGNGSYTLTITDKNGVYAPISTTFELYTEKMPVAYDEAIGALVAAEGCTAQDLENYIKSIASVVVDGVTYAASGRNAVKIINDNGTIITSAAPLKDKAKAEIVVNATGYQPLAFTYTKEEAQYVLMNIPYDEFYKAELKNNPVSVDAFSSATKSKTRGSMVAGSYHVSDDGSDISGITYPVKVHEGVNLSGCKLVSAGDVVTITVTNRGQTTTISYNGKDALFENEHHAYYVLSENEMPDYYKDLTVDKDGNWIFGKSYGEVTTKADVEAELLTESEYGDYQLNLDGVGLSENTAVYAVVLETKEDQSYGLRHMENIWKQTELSWCTGFTTSIHSCPTSSEHYKAIMGQTITNVVYYTSEGIFNIPINEYVPKKFAYTLKVENASMKADSTTFTLEGLPNDFKPVYSVDGLDIEVTGDKLSFKSKTEGVDVSNGSYTFNISDGSEIYAPINTDFELYREDMPVAYDSAKKSLVAAPDYAEKDLEEYIGKITSVTVSDNTYSAVGHHGAVKIISENGAIITDAEPLKDVTSCTIKVSATGYLPLEFTYPEVDATALNEAIAKAEKLIETDYTADSWAKLQTALNEAKTVLSKTGGLQSEVDAAAEALQTAIDALVKNSTGGNTGNTTGSNGSSGSSGSEGGNQTRPKKGTEITLKNVKYRVTGTSAATAQQAGNKTITSASIPATITINGYSFKVTAVANSAFSGCKKLKTVQIGTNVTTIGNKAFANCTVLTTAKGLTKVTSIGTQAFSGCKKLVTVGSKSKAVTLAKVKTIGNKAFYGCKAVKKVNITSTALTKIGVSAFQGCTALTSVTAKSTKLATIGKKAFYGDSKLATITLKTTQLKKAKVGAQAFKNIKSNCTFKVPSKKVASYKAIFKAKGAGKKIKVKKA